MAMTPFGNAVSNSANNKANWNLTTSVQKRQNDYQAEQNQIDREWQETQWLKQFNMQNEEWYKQLDAQQKQWMEQFDITNKYNSPKELVQRLLMAGINPANALSQLSGMAGLSSASPSASSGGSVASPGTMGSHSVTPSSFNAGGWEKPSAAFSSIAQLGDTVAKLASVGLDAKRQQALLDKEVENVVADTASKREQALLTSIDRSLKETFGSEKLQAEIKKLYSDSYVAYSQGDLNKANELYSQAMEKITSVQAEATEAQLPYLVSNLKQLGMLYKSQQVSNYASAAASNSVAALNNSLTSTENALRDGKVTALDLSNKLADIQRQLSSRENLRDAATHQDKIIAIINQCEREGFVTKAAAAGARKAVTDANWSGVEHFVGCASQALGSVSQLGGVYNGYIGNVVGAQRNAIQERFVQYYGRAYGVDK